MHRCAGISELKVFWAALTIEEKWCLTEVTFVCAPSIQSNGNEYNMHGAMMHEAVVCLPAYR
jgi:hypothetical protein